MNLMKAVVGAVIVLCIVTMWEGDARGYSIQPEATEQDGRIRVLQPNAWTRFTDRAAIFYLEHFMEPVHERVTHHIFGCSGDIDECGTPRKPHTYAPDAIIAGSRWNDNPPFRLEKTGLQHCRGVTIRLPNFSECWFTLYLDAKKRASEGEFFDARSGAVMLYRVHFGDMQFVHAMATRNNEKASVTKQNIMMWAEFTYKVSLGEIKPGEELRKTGIPGMGEFFFNRGWTPQQLFTWGDPTFRKEKDFRDFAFGSLLHMVEDSFVRSHVNRDEPSGARCDTVQEELKPGRILSFHSYVHQDPRLHHDEDTSSALDMILLTTRPAVVHVGKVIEGYYKAKRPWADLKGYLECVFELENPDVPAGPGEEFVADMDEPGSISHGVLPDEGF